MTGGVTFYTSFEVRPVTAIMLKKKVYPAQGEGGKKVYEHVA